MKILVHMVKGKLPDQELEVGGETSVDYVKTVLQDKVGTPAKDLILLYKGKAMQGAQSIASYGIKDGTKLYLAVKVPQPASETAPTVSRAPVFKRNHEIQRRLDRLLTNFLLKHYSAEDAAKVLQKVHEALICHVDSPNLDMIEGVARRNLEMLKLHPS